MNYEYLETLPLDKRVEEINRIRMELHNYSPFKDEPVDCVIWAKNESVVANDYNPNNVAPPEMKLLETSIDNDGYTQPIVAWPRDGVFEVIDGFHRHRVGKESKGINKRIHGYLPLAVIKETQTDKGDRIASTIRHNRARGKHKVDAMSDIVIELKKRNWSNDKIAKNLGMDADEILRLCQIKGLEDVFRNQEFSAAWEAEIYKEEDFVLLTEADIDDVKVKNTNRIFHTWEKWECYKAGFYSDNAPLGMSIDDCETRYKEFLSDLPLFEKYLARVITEWKFSCEHYLTNENMNRIAWLGQASMCLYSSVPSKYRGGYNLLTGDQKIAADSMALVYLNKWLKANNRPEIESLESAISKTEANLY